jgi:hypothetical protein
MAIVSLVAIAAVIGPILRQPPQDSFPLSTYPMFSSLIEPVTAIDLAVGVDTNGADVRLSPELIAGTDEVIIAGSTLRQSVRAGTTAELCVEIAQRVADQGDSSVVEIQIRTDTLDAIAWYASGDGGREPVERIVRSVCEVRP